MNFKKHKGKDRREFIKDMLRVCALGGLTFMGVGLVLKKKDEKDAFPDCRLNRPCIECCKLNQCTMPRAQSFRE
jgi:hypothetical protein